MSFANGLDRYHGQISVLQLTPLKQGSMFDLWAMQKTCFITVQKSPNLHRTFRTMGRQSSILEAVALYGPKIKQEIVDRSEVVCKAKIV